MKPQADGTTDVVVVISTTEVDQSTCPAFEAEIQAHLDPVPSRLVIDLGAVEFLDSSGVRVLLIVERTMADAGGDLVLRDPGSMVLRTLEASGTLDHFKVEHRPTANDSVPSS